MLLATVAMPAKAAQSFYNITQFVKRRITVKNLPKRREFWRGVLRRSTAQFYVGGQGVQKRPFLTGRFWQGVFGKFAMVGNGQKRKKC
jgi:hypothetical protein